MSSCIIIKYNYRTVLPDVKPKNPRNRKKLSKFATFPENPEDLTTLLESYNNDILNFTEYSKN
jgi:hypothetical protein